LAIRLLDGSSIKHRFPSGSILADVRKWIDSNRTDGEVPYSILSLFPHRLFSVLDEQETLVSLELHPSATIILKPVNDYVNAYNPVNAVDRVRYGFQSGVSWIWSFVGPFFWFGSSQQPSEAESRQFQNDERQDASEFGSSTGQTRTIRDLRDQDRDRRTYNGNQLNLEDDG